MRIRVGLILASLGLAAAAAGAAGPSQKIYRCGSEGRVYSQTPCKDGYEVAADDARSVEQRRAAEATAKSDAQAAERMTREREARERAAARLGPAVIVDSSRARPPAAAASSPAKKKAGRAAPKTQPTPQR